MREVDNPKRMVAMGRHTTIPEQLSKSFLFAGVNTGGLCACLPVLMMSVLAPVRRDRVIAELPQVRRPRIFGVVKEVVDMLMWLGPALLEQKAWDGRCLVPCSDVKFLGDTPWWFGLRCPITPFLLFLERQ